ncbi:histidinol dehydrogenase [Roseibacillus ishigakijimensis]|uniref:Histidinol dehydrogenase n=1 Tax=Roseibacillus ishigakijimensis TaxID=454146 RepID=A0A934RT41_9BACT|nr:histidinol dehydrogenase [Roseibacillus ishigakijimensis]MBK1835166.1 histidinol dehydrogenase [Roseibacillus ishigakijimensis]
MKVVAYSSQADAEFLQSLDRRALPSHEVRDIVAGIIRDVRERGDEALLELTRKFDRADLAGGLLVSEEEWAEAEEATSEATREAIAASLRNITFFAKKSQRQDWSELNEQGVQVGERFVPYERVGCYVPGGKAPLVSTALMTAGFAQAAGVPEIVAATPCGPDSKVNSALLSALKAAGVTEVLKVGGAQGVAALALGTESVAPVQKIVGPGNSFVVEAKRQLIGAVSIDLLPGPSEIMVLADDSAHAAFVAADLLGQAEHGPDSVVGLVTPSRELVDRVLAEVERQAATLSRGDYLRQVLADGAFAVIVPDLVAGVEVVNAFAPEHLSLVVEDDSRWLGGITTASAIYVGSFSPVAVGDFLAGPSHTLPTGGSGKSFSGLRADQFQRRISVVRMDQPAVARSVEAVEEFARVEGLDAHGRSVRIRVED